MVISDREASSGLLRCPIPVRLETCNQSGVGDGPATPVVLLGEFSSFETPICSCGLQRTRFVESYLLGSLGDSSPLLPWLSGEDGLPSLLSFPSFPQHFTSLCLFNASFLENAFSHPSHGNGFTAQCILLCLLRS